VALAEIREAFRSFTHRTGVTRHALFKQRP
jgi:hypothetical protein